LTGKRSIRQAPVRRKRRPPARRLHLGWRTRLIGAACATVLVLLIWGAIALQLAPVSNTSLTRFDAIVVLGTPADSDGNPTPTMLARVTEAVHEYERGVAPRLILTGGAAHNRFVEARVMAQAAHAQGIPDSVLFIEPEAQDTLQNTCYATRIMKAHGWSTAEVISDASRLPRVGILFSRLPLEWRMHAAPPLSPESPAHSMAASSVETLKTVRYLLWSRWAEHCEP
jgi:uncharacterized SAM-binding protein YcdF (DUF218 family)